ncbi:MAG: TonB-dependent receptor [Terracidiphilus sp.]
MRQARYRFLLLPLIFVLACVGAFAQANADLTGIVTDQTGAVVAGASVMLTDQATGAEHNTTSSSTGLYDIPGLNPGNYNLKVSAKNFETFVQNGIVVNVSATARVDVKLTVGAESQTITVSADALTVQADSNVVSSLISSEEISEIATENRNFAALAALGMGVSSALPDNNTPAAFSSNFTISFNGLRQSHNIWLIDGGESDDRGGAVGMQIQPSQDAVAEFQVMSSNYPPDYGISSGATISLSLKSGTKKFHGSAWEENRATAYDANYYWNKLATPFVARPAVHYNIYGFNVGGPLYIPHTYNTSKQKTFFFWNEEWRKTSSVGGSSNNVLDPADRPVAGQDLKYVPPTFSPTTQLLVPAVPGGATSYYATAVLSTYEALALTPGKCFNNGVLSAGGVCSTQPIIPHQLFDVSIGAGNTIVNNNNAITYLTGPVIPTPNVSGQDNNIASVPLPLTDRDDIVRIDHNITDKWAILGHYIGDLQNQDEGAPELGWCWCQFNTLTDTLKSPAHSGAIKLSGTINPNLLVEASINYDGNGADITPSANTFLPSSWNVQPLVPTYAVSRRIWPGIFSGGPYNFGEDTATEPYHNAAQDYEPKLDVSYTKGQHALKFGFSYNRYTKNQMLYGDAQGNYTFYGAMSGDGLMDMLMGLAGSYTQALSAPIRHYANQTPSAYAMDNWHITPRLSVQLGLRYDALPHAFERNNYIGNFDPATYQSNALPVWESSGAINPVSPSLYTFEGIPSYINGTDLAGQNHTPPGLVNNDYETLQPRIGFSEDLSGNGKTVLRGGFGTFYERMQGNDIFDTATSAPFDPAVNGIPSPFFSQPGTNWDTGAVTLPTSLIFASADTSLAKTYKAPAAAMYSLGVQREVVPSLIWIVQYVGNMAWHQNIGRGLNNMSPSIGPQNIAAPTAAPNIQDPRCTAGDGGGKYTTNGLVVSASNPSPDANCGAFNNWGGMNAFRQYQGYTSITQNENDTNGYYNGFQTGLRAQNKWGLSGEIDYTYSHEIDITSYDESGSGQNISNPFYLKYDRGSGALDRRSILSADYVYKLPIFNKSAGLLKSTLGGWEIAGTIIDESGTPVAPGGNATEDTVGLGGTYTSRPNKVPYGFAYHKTRTNWFDTTTFYDPTPAYDGGSNLGFGNAGKDTLVGPGRVNFTTSLYKTFSFWDRASFTLRFESFNTFNHSEWNGINAGMSCAAGTGQVSWLPCQANPGTGGYGQVTGTWDPRNLELGGKFVF